MRNLGRQFLGESPLAALSFAALIGIWIGYLIGSQYFTDVMARQREFRQELKAAEKSQRETELALAELRTEADIDRLSLATLTDTVNSLEQDLAAANSKVRLYQNLMATPQDFESPAVRRIDITQKSPQGFGYRVVVEQARSKKGSNTEANLSLRLVGTDRGGEPKIYDLAQLQGVPGAGVIHLNLRYFRLVEGVINLPADFVPLEIEARLWPKGSPNEVQEFRFPWEVVR